MKRLSYDIIIIKSSMKLILQFVWGAEHKILFLGVIGSVHTEDFSSAQQAYSPAAILHIAAVQKKANPLLFPLHFSDGLTIEWFVRNSEITMLLINTIFR